MAHIENQNSTFFAKVYGTAARSLSSETSAARNREPVPGLSALLATFPTVHVDPGTPASAASEFVSFSQCVDFGGIAANPRDPDFLRISEIMQIYLRTARAAVAGLFWESFFSGSTLPIRADFPDRCRTIQAASFWLADTVVVPHIRAATPKGEILRSTDARNLYPFHPYRAFAAACVRDPGEILNHYLAGFGPRSSGAAELTRKVASYYADDAQKPAVARAVFTALSEAGVFGEYFARFCAHRNMPALTQEEVTPRNLLRTIQRLNHLPSATLARVKVRRALQTRAYFAVCIRHLIQSRHFFSYRPISFRHLVAWLDSYLEDLEDLLAALCAGRGTAAVDRGLKQADLNYATTAGDTLARGQVWCGKRFCLAPALMLNLDAPDTLAPRALQLVQNIAMPSVNMDLWPRESMAVIAQAAQMLKRTSPRNLGRACADMLKMKPAATRWSVPLSSFQPEKSRFRELLFWNGLNGVEQ